MSFLHSWAQLALAQLLFFRFLRSSKYPPGSRHRSLVPADYLVAALASGLLVALAGLHLIAALVAVVAGAALFSILWLDTALYRIFTVELGAGGIGDVVLSNLWAEMRKMRYAQRFFQHHRAFALFPIAVLVAHVSSLFPALLLRGGAELLLAAYFLWTLGPAQPPRTSPGSPARSPQRALVHEFIVPRHPHIPRGFCPRPEHAALLAPPALPPRSAEHGLLRGSSVVLLTFESLGLAHLGEGRACTPFLDSIAARRTVLRSQRHACLAPLTNAAHIALYFSRYTAAPAAPASPLQALQFAGYETAYLTSATLAHYGLAGILRTAGFQHLLDGRSLTVGSETGSAVPVSDHALLREGLARVRSLRAEGAGPLFLHVHGADSHIPYHVIDPVRFHRHELRDDRGRFLNSIEESDWIFGELWSALRPLLVENGAGEPLLVLSSDHGQAFGEHGYWSHGSAVISEELDVPLLLYHPRLAARTVRFSTHFDVLPTLCDLLGVEAAQPGHGASLLLGGTDGTEPAHLIWDGAPSRSTSTCLGLLLGSRKYALDLARDTLVVSELDDTNRRLLTGDERVYFEALIGRLAQLRGVG